MSPWLFLVALVAALVFWARFAGHEGASWPATLVKTLSTAALALGGWAAGGPSWVVLGLALGAVGDFALARRGTGAFLAGMVAFAAGHLAYAGGFALEAARLSGAPGAVALALWVLVLGLVAVGWVWVAPRAGGLRWPVRIYALVIGAMVAAAAQSGQALFILGALVFMASDLILGVRMFILQGRSAQLLASRVLWPLYWGGQALILLGTLS